jgi:predicted RND superfamily exporter protein
VPLAFTGGFLGLKFMNEPISMMALMGFLVLMGTVVNNGIVYVDYTNQLRIGGLERHDALIAAGKTRMRPILMTAMTTILAEFSLCIGDSLSSQLGKGMGIVIIGGLAYATLMTLFIVPVIYDILFKKQPLNIDTGSESLDDIPDDAAEYLKEKEKEKAEETEIEKTADTERNADRSEDGDEQESGSDRDGLESGEDNPGGGE